MKKISIFLATAAIAALASVSCNKNELNVPEEPVGPKVSVRISGAPEDAREVDPSTRTYISETGSGYEAKWSNSGEALGVVLGDVDDKVQPAILEAEPTTDNNPIFTGELTAEDGTYDIFVFYPASAFGTGYNDGGLGFDLKKVQNPVLGSFDPSCDLMGYSTDDAVVENGSLVLEGIALQRPMAILRINLNADSDAKAFGQKVSSLKMQLPSDLILTGRAKISAAGMDWNQSLKCSYVKAEIDLSEEITVGESDGINAVYLVVNPLLIPAGTEINFIVETEDYNGTTAFNRTVTAPSDMQLQAGNVNVIGLKLRDKDLPTVSDKSYLKVTSDSDLEDGQYLIVYEEGSRAFNGGLSTLDATSNYIEVVIEDDAIPSTTVTDAAAFTIEAMEGGYSILSASGKYICQTANSNGLAARDEAVANSISIEESGDADIACSGNHLRYNATSGQDRFRYFKSSSYSTQKPVALYRLDVAADPTPKIIFASTEASVAADATSVEFTYSKNKYVNELPTVTFSEYSGHNFFEGVEVTDGKVTVSLIPNTYESENSISLEVTGQGVADQTFLLITQAAYVPGPSTVGSGTLEDPYTAGDIWTLYPESGSGDTQVYVTGTVTDIQEVSTQHGNATYTISDGQQSILVYRGKYLDNESFTSEDQIAVGDIAVVLGKISIYNNAPQLAQGNYLISLTVDPDVPSISVNPASLSWAADATDAQTITVSLNGNATGYSVSPASDANWNISNNGQGTITVSPKAANSSTTTEKTLSLVITHNDDSNVTKTVECTQAKNSALTIADLLAGGATTFTGTTGELLVYAVTGSNAIVGDSTGKILLYKSGHGYVAGDKFTVTNPVTATYQSVVLELTGGTFEKKSSGNPVDHGTAADLDVASVAQSNQTTFTSTGFHSAVYVKMNGAQSGRNITNSNSVVLYLNQANTTCDGKNVATTGYIYGYNTGYSNFYYHLVTIEEYVDPDAASISVDPTTLSWDADEYGADAEAGVSVTLNAGATAGNFNYSVVSGTASDWSITKSGSALDIYPKAANNGTSAKVLKIDIAHGDDATVKKTVTCTQNAAGGSGGDPVTVEIVISTYATDNSWTSGGGGPYTVTSGDVTLTPSDNGAGNANGLYYGDWRFYQARGGGLTVSVPSSKQLVEATFTYSVSKTGILLDPDGSQLPSGTKCSLSGQSALFTVGNTGTVTNGQVRFTKIVVVYK
ncbi:MAG: hypothetical protein IKP46_08120 [Bacteroidales bacterium]|nr:hypothetical protein [Bacteroidales bacterium]